MSEARIPAVDGSNWTVDQPWKHNRYTFESDDWVFIIRDMGTKSLWRLHAREKATGSVLTFGLRPHHRNPNGDGVDGFMPLYGAALRRVKGTMHPTDHWQVEAFPTNLNHLFTGIKEAA